MTNDHPSPSANAGGTNAGGTKPASTGTIAQINASGGGVPKLPVPEALVDERGITTDASADKLHHGLPHQALCLFPRELIAQLQAEGHPIDAGSIGENITTAGLDWRRVVPGARLRLGATVLIEVTDYTAPCWKNARWFADGDFNRINQKTHPGASRVYARVLHGGAIRPGDPIELIDDSAADRTDRLRIPTVRWPTDPQ